MRLSSSSGDFGEYVVRVEQKVEYFKDTKFRYVNLEQSGSTRELFSDNDDWKNFAERCAKAAEYANVTYVLSHAPCLHRARQCLPLAPFFLLSANDNKLIILNDTSRYI